MKTPVLLLLAVAATLNAATWRYWIQPCTDAGSGCRTGDPELANWAFQAWQHASKGRLIFKPTTDPQQARIAIVWGGSRDDIYGEARPITGSDGVKRFEIHVVPPEAPDELMRDAIVYLTCLHETGHALDLEHTGNFEDIMYSFEMGGRSREYFDRYRRGLHTRHDIRKHSAISKGDRRALIKSLK